MKKIKEKIVKDNVAARMYIKSLRLMIQAIKEFFFYFVMQILTTIFTMFKRKVKYWRGVGSDVLQMGQPYRKSVNA